uniref:Uncharacterized protein n=1 Tax=Aegilops tauschii TaxID=37682 RepID=M8BSX1_AEGTA
MARSELVMALLVVVLAAVCCASAGAVASLSKLPVTLDVTASPSPGQGATIVYAFLFFDSKDLREHESRKTHENLDKDKTCQYKVTEQPYTGAGGKVEYRVALDIPTATYYVRAYALDASGTQVAYGQTLRTATFNIVSIRGINTSIKVASGVFSTFSAVSLVFFFFIL